MIINTKSYKTQPYKSVTFDINCSSQDGMYNDTETFTLDTMLTVNEDSMFRVPNISAYAGSKWIYVPSGFQDIRGNSPELMNIDSNLTEVTVEYMQIQPVLSSYNGDKLTDLKSLRHIGENIFVAWNDEKAVFF